MSSFNYSINGNIINTDIIITFNDTCHKKVFEYLYDLEKRIQWDDAIPFQHIFSNNEKNKHYYREIKLPFPLYNRHYEAVQDITVKKNKYIINTKKVKTTYKDTHNTVELMLFNENSSITETNSGCMYKRHQTYEFPVHTLPKWLKKKILNTSMPNAIDKLLNTLNKV